MEKVMLELAKKHGVEPTEFLPKIAKVREKLGIELSICPCARDDSDRGCISAKCLREIEEQGHCHCNAYRRLEK